MIGISDLTYDGGVYYGGDVVRFLGITAYQYAHDIVLWTPFSGSSTQEKRALDKIVGYGVSLAVPGFAMEADTNNERGLTVVRDCLAFDKVRALIGTPLWREVRLPRNMARLMMHADKSGVLTASEFVDYMIYDDKAGDSFVEGCYGIKVSDKERCILLVDVPDSNIHVGAFSFRDPEQFAVDACMNFATEDPVIRTSDAPVQNFDVDVVVSELTPAKLKKALRSFRTPLVRNVLASLTMTAVFGVEHVLINSLTSTSSTHEVISVALVMPGRRAQLWSMDFAVSGPPLIRCIVDSGLYVTREPVCMGALTHFHAGEGVTFSMASTICGFVERIDKILQGDPEHLTSLGVVNEKPDPEHVAECHRRAYDDVMKTAWSFQW